MAIPQTGEQWMIKEEDGGGPVFHVVDAVVVDTDDGITLGVVHRPVSGKYREMLINAPKGTRALVTGLNDFLSEFKRV